MIWVVCGIAVLTLASWWLLQPRVTLDERGYDVTIALYRVCNQRSVEGLDRIESALKDSLKKPQDATPTYTAISRVIESARKGQWSDAQRDCRQLLEDQVSR